MHIFTAIILCFSISLVIAMSGLLSKPVHPDIEIFFEDEDDDDDLAYDRGYDQDDTLVIDPRTYLDPKIALSREDIGRQISAAGSVLCQPVSTSSKTAHVVKEEKRSIDHIRLSQTFVDIEFARMAVIKDCGCRNAYCLRQPDGKDRSLLTGVIEKSIELVK
jgi:hypothetical protein